MCKRRNPNPSPTWKIKFGFLSLGLWYEWRYRTYGFRQRIPNQSPAQRVRFGAEEQRREHALTFEKSRSKRYKACSDVVPVVGLEPTRYRYQRILSPSRLPIPSHRRKETHLLYKRHPENSRGSFLFRRRKMNRP